MFYVLNNSYLSRKWGGKGETMYWNNYCLCTCCISERHLMQRECCSVVAQDAATKCRWYRRLQNSQKEKENNTITRCFMCKLTEVGVR